ncbi:sugar porter family MFS transporter [Aspergillus brunneoviolaceus CBS 621.78]|uniref:General substrate transporter n=1 Tax=Aspergillus brunneoviolaceus CBS 621.78 TaxID=1450534 RepID=A0ACD1FZV1_9EURO|nr:general substrate transporter [Aspergillus brunneoviolaceus CBS 621.78]RAH42504.1 general substrate transporter [Aspergillus brunneoviolaceus CBS 621.78]
MTKISTLLSAVFLAIGGFLFGYDSGIVTSTIAQTEFIKYFSNPSDTVTGGVVSAFQGGAILGTIINMFTGDRLGRKLSVFAGACISVFGCALQAGAVNMTMLIIGRFIAGAAVGMLTSTVPMYAGEMAEAQTRGMMSGLLQWMLSWGYLVAQWLGYGCSFNNTAFQWRFPLAFQCVPGVVLMCGVWFLQESPRWLMEQDRHEEALATLHKLHGDGTPEKTSYIELEYQEIRDTIEAERAHNSITWTSILTKPSWRRRLILGCGVQAFGPLSGINVINYYATRIYSSLGFDTRTTLMIVGISGALSIVWATIGLWALERVGRVKPLIISAAGMAGALVCNAAMSQHWNENNANQLRAMVAMNFVFSFFYTAPGIISWVYPAEIFPVDIRNQGNSCTTFVNWSVNLIFAQFSPTALTNIGFRYFYVFFVFNIIAMICYIFFFPETKGKTLEQMDALFGDDLPAVGWEREEKGPEAVAVEDTSKE